MQVKIKITIYYNNVLSGLKHVRSRKATIEELQSCHSEQYSLIFGGNPYNRQKLFGNYLLVHQTFYIILCWG